MSLSSAYRSLSFNLAVLALGTGRPSFELNSENLGEGQNREERSKVVTKITGYRLRDVRVSIKLENQLSDLCSGSLRLPHTSLDQI